MSFWPTAYDPELVAAVLRSFSELVPRYYANAVLEPQPVSPRIAPDRLVELAAAEMSKGGATSTAAAAARVSELAAMFLSHAQRLHSPHYVGHQVPAAVPVAALFDALTRATNQGLASVEMGPFAMAAERALVRHLGHKIGWDMSTSDAIATSGGTLANLTAIVAARQARYTDVWKRGTPSGVRPAVVCSADAHYCIARAAGIMGFGTDQVVKVPVDAERRMRGAALATALDQAEARGLDVFCVVASAPSTPIGAFDAMDEIAAVTKARGLWLHVDGAHGASFLFSERLRGLLSGIEEADSITWDAHKMLFVPSLSTFLFYKDAAASYRVFDQDAPYIWSGDAPTDSRAFEGGLRTVECTKGGISVGLWGMLATFGDGLIEELLDRSVDVTRAFYERLRAAPDFEPLHEPACNILCFRYLPAGSAQKKIRAGLLDRRSFYLSQTTLDGVDALRVTIINPHTAIEHLDALMEEIRDLGRAL